MNTFRNPTTVHAPVAAYSHQAEIQEPACWLTLAGQIGMRPDGIVPDEPLAQLEVALENVRRNLEAARMDVRNLVKLTIYLVGEFDVAERRAITTAFLGEHRPCVTLLFIAALADPVYRVEVEAWACR